MRCGEFGFTKVEFFRATKLIVKKYSTSADSRSAVPQNLWETPNFSGWEASYRRGSVWTAVFTKSR